MVPCAHLRDCGVSISVIKQSLNPMQRFASRTFRAAPSFSNQKRNALKSYILLHECQSMSSWPLAMIRQWHMFRTCVLYDSVSMSICFTSRCHQHVCSVCCMYLVHGCGPAKAELTEKYAFEYDGGTKLDIPPICKKSQEPYCCWGFKCKF